MNPQKPGIEWTHPYGLPGFTANPLRGCTHMCRWQMPGGDVAVCYAKTQAERIRKASQSRMYSQGFEHVTFHPKTLAKIRNRKQSAAIFIDSMSDLFGANVKREWIAQVLLAMAESPQHVFFSLTKNAKRLSQFRNLIPPNTWVGVSAPAHFMNHEDDEKARLSLRQQSLFWQHALFNLGQVKTPVRFLSVEPFSHTMQDRLPGGKLFMIDLVELLTKYADSFNWVIIGAATNGVTTYQPDIAAFAMLFDTLNSMGKPVFFKGNIDPDIANMVAGKWYEDYPPIELGFNVDRAEAWQHQHELLQIIESAEHNQESETHDN